MKKDDKDYHIPDETYDVTVTERLYHYIVEMKHMKRNPFYDLTGVANGTLDRKGGITTDSIQKVLEHFPNLNTNWLVQGKGQPEIVVNETVISLKDFESLKEKLTERLDELNELRKELDTVRKENEYLKKLSSKF